MTDRYGMVPYDNRQNRHVPYTWGGNPATEIPTGPIETGQFATVEEPSSQEFAEMGRQMKLEIFGDPNVAQMYSTIVDRWKAAPERIPQDLILAQQTAEELSQREQLDPAQRRRIEMAWTILRSKKVQEAASLAGLGGLGDMGLWPALVTPFIVPLAIAIAVIYAVKSLKEGLIDSGALTIGLMGIGVFFLLKDVLFPGVERTAPVITALRGMKMPKLPKLAKRRRRGRGGKAHHRSMAETIGAQKKKRA